MEDETPPPIDPNETLSKIRNAYTRWAEADAQSDEEWNAARDMAWAWVDLDRHLKAGGDLPVDWDVSAEVPYEAKARALVHEGKKIQAIKEVRAATGWGLKEAKEYVDSLV